MIDTKQLIAEVRTKAMAMDFGIRWTILEMANRLEMATAKIAKLEKSNRNWRRKYQRLKATRKQKLTCKDCTEWDNEEQECKHWYGFHADDFCSHGERKNE